MRKLAPIVLALALACTTSVKPPVPDGKGASGGSDDAGSPRGHGDASTPGGAGGLSSGTSTSPGASSPTAGDQKLPLELTLSQKCAEPNQTMRATAATEPRSRLGFVASYRDDNYFPDFTYVEAAMNPTGTYTWSWVVKPDTPRGEALVTVVAAKEGRGGARKARFRVADSC